MNDQEQDDFEKRKADLQARWDALSKRTEALKRQRTCETCEYAFQTDWIAFSRQSKDHRVFECRRNPPKSNAYPQYPLVDPDKSCREYKTKRMFPQDN